MKRIDNQTPVDGNSKDFIGICQCKATWQAERNELRQDGDGDHAPLTAECGQCGAVVVFTPIDPSRAANPGTDMEN